MHSPISNLHRQLLKRFHFSIGGYSNPEKEVSNFFYKLCKNELIYQNESIRFLMFGFAQLSVNNINEIDLDRWRTEPLSKFNYFDYSSGYAEVLLSLYIHCLNEICGDKRATNIISDNVRRDINLRFLIGKEDDKFHFRENKRLEALEIIVPENIIFDTSTRGIDLNSFEDSCGRVIKNFVSQDEEFEHEYKIDDQEKKQSKKCYEELAAKIFKIQPSEFAAKINDYLPSSSIQNKIKLNTLRNPDADLKQILAVAYAASLFCYFFDCSMEYFVSVSNVSSHKKFSLGSIAVGVKNGAELSFDERAMISIISNHIASNLSAQIIFNNNKEIKRKAFRKVLREKYDSLKDLKDLSSELHGVKEIKSDQLKVIKDLVNKSEDVFSSDFNVFLDELLKANSNHISKYCLLELKDPRACRCKIEKPLHQFSKQNAPKYKCCAIGRMKSINVPFISNLFYKFTEDQDEGECTVKDRRIEGNQIIFDVEYTHAFPIIDFYTKLKASHNGDLIGTYFIQNYPLLDAHGIFKIVDGEGKELFNSRETINMVAGNKLILNESQFVLGSSDLKKLQLIFVNELT